MRIVVVFLMASLACAQQTKARIAEGFDSIQVARLKADVTFLSCDALEGRRSLERGSEVAIQWIASEFAKAGLKPLVGASYPQPGPLIPFTVAPAARAAHRIHRRPGTDHASGAARRQERDVPRAGRHGELRKRGRRFRAGGLRRLRHQRTGTRLRRLRRA